ncbi:MAG TPA: hypothetical protein VEC60_16500, partial [Reyranella sp.]|nr:hypothetical protein [Reyranella sp.]
MASLKRLAVVVPPEEWFRGWPLYAYYETYRRALADLGVETIDVPMRVFLQPLDLARHADMLGEVRDFQPQAAIALHIGTFLVHCRLPPNRDGWRPHFLAELLDLPSIA